MASTFRNIRDNGNLIVADVASLPATAPVGTLAVDASTTDVYVFDGTSWQLKTASGSAGVTSFNSRTGVVVPASGDYTASEITNVPTSPITSTNVQDAINELVTLIPTGTANTFTGFDSSGNIQSIPGFSVDTLSGGMVEDLIIEPNGGAGAISVNTFNVDLDPLQNSPDETWNVNNIFIDIDTGSSGFNLGTNGAAVNAKTTTIKHHGTSDVGGLAIFSNNFDIGNGTDPINVDGISYSYGFGQINANANITGNIQGYGFQPAINSAATIDSGVIIQAFYDTSNISTATYGYTSYTASPSILSISNNSNYVGYNTSPSITNLIGNAGMTGIAVSPTIGSVGSTGSFQGVGINPTITTNNNYAVGININMAGVTNYAGAQATLVLQDITYTMISAGTFGNSITIEYTNTVTAGNEVASISGNAITVQIESGVSTATQVVAAIVANITLNSNITAIISGTASDPQTTAGPTNLAGGIDPGRKLAIDTVGDVNISGSLSFTGGLSIGALSSYAPQDLSLLPSSGVNSIDTLITAPFVSPSDVVSGADLLAVNTAMLLTIGAGATVTTDFLGITALGLPAVVTMGAGATIDRVGGAVFAVSLDAAGAGGTVDIIDLCRAVSIPNGVTAVNKLVGFKMDLPFGDPGTTSWGFYEQPGIHNYMAGDLLIGGTAGSDDTVSNSSVAFEIKSTTKALLNARMTSTQRNALTAINGMQIYNTTTDKLQVYAAGSWVDLH